MKVPSLLLFFGLIIAHVTCEKETAVEDPCAELTIEDCVHTEFSEYMKCIEETKSKRLKRQVQCPFLINAQQPVQQQVAYYPAQQQIIQNPAVVPCITLPCQQPISVVPQPYVPIAPVQEVINADLDPIIENHVENLPQAPGHRNIIVVPNKDDTPIRYSNNLVPGHNITTVINLNNIINNTNIIDSPTNINNTNINNIHIYQNKTSTSGGKYGLGYTEKGSCCFAVRPKTCRKTSNGPKCHHHRHKTCGTKCTSRIIHAQVRRRCTSHSGCHRRTVHVPQPQPPRCISSYYWPYTSCGGYQSNSCEGCYDHYGYGHENYYGGNDNSRCNGCYDDGYDHGPLYRRGPVLRPTHYHEPPCDLTGSCDGDYYSNSNGYFGHDRIDPAFHDDEYAIFEGDERDFSRVFNISEINGSGEEINDEEGGDWAMQTQKCRVVEEANGTIIIRNCTIDDLENQYAGSPQSDIYDEPARRNVRRSSPPYYNYPPPPPPIYYPAPLPYMSPYMAPIPPPSVQYMPPVRHRRPNYYENDEEQEEYDDAYDNEADYRPRTKSLVKKHNKQRANRFPIDEEDLDSFKEDDRDFSVYNANDYDQ